MFLNLAIGLLCCFAVVSSISYLGFAAVSLIVIALLIGFYFAKYWRVRTLGVELAYFGLCYAAVAIALLGIGLLQTHAGCTFLIGDCYQTSLPFWLFYFKIFFGLLVHFVNSVSLFFILRNFRSLFFR